MRKITLMATVFGLVAAATVAQAESNQADERSTTWINTTTNETPDISQVNLWEAAQGDQGFSNLYSRRDVVGPAAPHPLFVDLKREAPKAEAKAPEPKQVAVTPPVPAVQDEIKIPTIVEDVVFFDFDKAEMRPEERIELSEIAKSANSETRFQIQGHADRSGDRVYNEELSRFRVINVAEVLTTYGVNADQIDMTWEGETETAIPTPDGEREQLNRRVELKIIQN